MAKGNVVPVSFPEEVPRRRASFSPVPVGRRHAYLVPAVEQALCTDAVRSELSRGYFRECVSQEDRGRRLAVTAVPSTFDRDAHRSPNQVEPGVHALYGGMSKGERNRIKIRVPRWPPKPRWKAASSADVRPTVIGSPTQGRTRTPARRPTSVEQAAQSRDPHRRRRRGTGPRDENALEPDPGMGLLHHPGTRGAHQTKLDRYRAALDAGTDPVLVQQWITQVQAEKAVAEADLRRSTGRRTMTADEINTLVEDIAGFATILRKPTLQTKPRSTGNSLAAKAALLSALGVQVYLCGDATC